MAMRKYLRLKETEMRGKIAVTVTTLQMLERPEGKPLAAPADGIEIRFVPAPTVAFYRFLYNSVGEEWLWGDRRKMPDDELARIISHPKVDLYVLYFDHQPAGYAELDARSGGETQLAFFGLLPGFVGKKLGPYLLTFAIHKAWETNPKRFWVHTCTLDHPAALGVYKKYGFIPYKTENVVWDDPRALGLIPRHIAPQHPIQR